MTPKKEMYRLPIMDEVQNPYVIEAVRKNIKKTKELLANPNKNTTKIVITSTQPD